MQFFKKIVYGFLFTPMFSFAQQQPHHNHQFCGVNGHMNQAIKEKMLLERSSVSMEAIEELQNRRAAINIPITFTNLGDGDGNGYTDIDKILDVFCALNDGYGNMNVHFHMKFPIRYLDNSNAFLDAFDTGGGTAMSFLKRPNSLNAYVGPSLNNPAASFYSPSGDYVFLLNSQIDGLNGGKTTRHEVGHFFSLPHTFSGWEGTNVISEYGCDTLVSGLLGFVPEYVDRTGDDANCGSAGDGFCDTEADYYSNRVPCSLVPCAKDPLGNTINPDNTNVMSYFGDDCVDWFSTEQEIAVLSNINQRNWANFAPPTANALSGTVTMTSASQVDVVNESFVRLSWDPKAAATAYYIEISRVLNGNSIAPFVTREVVYGNMNTNIVIDSDLFNLGDNYMMRVRPFNEYYACTGHEGTAEFLAGESIISNIQKTGTNNLSLELLNNPVFGNEIMLNITSNKTYDAQLAFYAINGSLLTVNPSIRLEKGEQTQSIDVRNLADGMYVAVLTTEEGSLQQKVMVKR